MIVQQLHAIQARCGYLPREELVALANRLSCPLFRIQEVASFFPHFRLQKSSPVQVRICRDMACALRGSRQLAHELQQNLQGQNEISICEVSCLGRCDRAPAVIVENTALHTEHLLTQATPEKFQTYLQHPVELENDATFSPQACDQWTINVYDQKDASERYRTLKQGLACKTQEQREAFKLEIIHALETANLLGMGGAGGRAYKKWSEVKQAAGDKKFVVCNADESEPGTFKDRELLLRTPYLIVEGVLLGGFVVNAQRGYIYVRHEYPEQIEALQSEIERATLQGLCNIENTMKIEVFVSPGGYICGEQTALIEAMEDKRAEPRNRPPELQTNGLWNCPTLLNNVETLAWVPAICQRESGKWYAEAGATADYKGRRFFSVSGDITHPGVYEVPIGITLGELIDQYCGGMRNSVELKAVALSGPSGGFLPAQVPAEHCAPAIRDALNGKTHYDIRQARLDIANFRKLRWMLGAGIVIYGQDANLVEQTLACSTFYKEESCGKCVPCRIGSHKLLDIVQSLYEKRLTRKTFQSLMAATGEVAELSQTMTLTAICGLGTVASNPLVSLLRYFPQEIEPYLLD